MKAGLKAAFLLLIVTISCCAQEPEKLDLLGKEEAESRYLRMLFDNGAPLAGLFTAKEGSGDDWSSLEMIWFDSTSNQYLWHEFSETEFTQSLQAFYYKSKKVDSLDLKALERKVAEKAANDRDLALPNQNSKLFLPLKIWGIPFNQSLDANSSFGPWQSLPCDRPRRAVVCTALGDLRAEAGLFSTRNPRIRRVLIKGLNFEQALAHLDTLVEHIQEEPEYINWTVFAKKPLIHGFETGDLFTLSVIFQSPYPAFRLVYDYRALQGELEIKIQNTRPDYGVHPKRKKLCAFGDGANYACEFLTYDALKAKRNP